MKNWDEQKYFSQKFDNVINMGNALDLRTFDFYYYNTQFKKSYWSYQHNSFTQIGKFPQRNNAGHMKSH